MLSNKLDSHNIHLEHRHIVGQPRDVYDGVSHMFDVKRGLGSHPPISLESTLSVACSHFGMRVPCLRLGGQHLLKSSSARSGCTNVNLGACDAVRAPLQCGTFGKARHGVFGNCIRRRMGTRHMGGEGAVVDYATYGAIGKPSRNFGNSESTYRQVGIGI